MILYMVQIFSFFACIMSAVSKKKKSILIWVCIANLSNFAVMLIARETDGWANSFITCVRALLFLYKDKAKSNLLFYFCLLLHTVAFVLSYQDVWSCLLICATLSVCISQWWGNAKQIKIGALISVLCWCVYTIHVELYLDLPKRIVEAVFLVISLYTIKQSKQAEKKA